MTRLRSPHRIVHATTWVADEHSDLSPMPRNVTCWPDDECVLRLSYARPRPADRVSDACARLPPTCTRMDGT